MQRHAAQQLHIKVAHLHDALGALAHHGKGFGQHRIQRFAIGHTGLELFGLGLECVIAELFELGLQRIDASHHRTVSFEQTVVTTSEDFGKNVGCHASETGLLPRVGAQNSAVLFLIKVK